MAAIGAVASLVGSIVSAAGTVAAGKAQQQAAEYEAKQLDIKAKNEQAAAQREANELTRRRDLAVSTLQTRAAQSGFTATDPTALALQDEITRYGTYQSQVAQFGGEDRRAGYEAKAETRRLEGRAARIGASYAAAGTILGGIGGLAKGFGGGGSSGGSPSYMYG